MDAKVDEAIEKNDIEEITIKKMPEKAGRMKDVYHIKGKRNEFALYLYLHEKGGERDRNRKQRRNCERFIFEKIRDKTCLRSPKVIDHGKNYLLCEWLPGNPIGIDVDSKQEKIEVARRMGKALKQIHGINFRQFGEIGIRGVEEPYDNWKDFIEKSINLMRGRADEELVVEAFDYLEKNLTIMRYDAEPVLIHGDFHHGNILNGERLGILDCEAGFSGSREYEIDRCIFHWTSEWGVTDEFLESYGKDLLAEDWKERKKFYRIFHAARGVLDGKKLSSDHLIEINERELKKKLRDI
jgi:fructosamine-3-kinase